LAKKPINVKSIIVGLSRLKLKISQPVKVIKPIAIVNLSIHAEIEELTYEKTKDNIKLFRDVYKNLSTKKQNYLTATQGINEITIIGGNPEISSFTKILNRSTLLSHKKGLVSITVKLPKAAISTPNTIYLITKKLAIKKINLIEIVSTFSELTFIIDKKDAQLAVEQLSKGLN
jgi:aspartokinase